MDCLDELACVQTGVASSSVDAASESSGNVGGARGAEGNHPGVPTSDSPPSPPTPPGFNRIPNPRIELARHLQTQTLSTFVLQSCPGLRMPTFERWLLDSKLEESDRFQSVIEEWMDDPSSKAARADGKPKKKYGRAAMYQRKNDETNAREEREKSRKERDRKLVSGAERLIPAGFGDRRGRVGSLIRHVDRDPILPYLAMEYDPSCDRLLKEIVAATPCDDSGSESDRCRILKKSREIVRELCQRTTETCRELHHLERRLGKFHKFGGDNASAGERGKKKRKGGGGGGGGNVDRVLVEWPEEDAVGESPRGHRVCSLVYVAKKRKSARASLAAAETPPRRTAEKTTHRPAGGNPSRSWSNSTRRITTSFGPCSTPPTIRRARELPLRPRRKINPRVHSTQFSSSW